MASSRNRIVAVTLAVTAAVTGLLGLYFLVVKENVTLGAILLVVAMSDVAGALLFSRRG
jgi:hypothetical protein